MELTRLFDGSLFMGVAAIGDCPVVHGQLVKMDATSGALQQVFDAVPANCLGGGIWSSPTIDEAAGVVYVSTGTTRDCAAAEPYSQGFVAISTKDLAVLGFWTAPAAEQVPDGDFGATPTLFTATIGVTDRRLVGAINKSGIYYAFDRTNLRAGPLWQSPRLTSPPAGSRLAGRPAATEAQAWRQAVRAETRRTVSLHVREVKCASLSKGDRLYLYVIPLRPRKWRMVQAAQTRCGRRDLIWLVDTAG